jgi:hypothetical protein
LVNRSPTAPLKTLILSSSGAILAAAFCFQKATLPLSTPLLQPNVSLAQHAGISFPQQQTIDCIQNGCQHNKTIFLA